MTDNIIMNGNTMNLNKYIDLYKPLAIFLKGSAMLEMDLNESDLDIEIYVDNEEIPLKNYKDKENNWDILFLNKNLQNNLPSLWEIGLLQFLFLKEEHILYRSEKFNFNEFIQKIILMKEDLLYSLCKKFYERIKFYSYHKYSKKIYYHLCYLSSLIDNSQVDWNIIKNIKSYSEIEKDIEYIEKCRIKLLNFFYEKLSEKNERKIWTD